MVDSNVAKVWYQWGLNQGDTSKFDYNPQEVGYGGQITMA